ncbi:MAG: BREX-3 system phosphatase PglZ [Bacillota bacterium]
MLRELLRRLPLQECSRILVYDIDNLFEDEMIIQEIISNGFNMVHYDDPEVFRYSYEKDIKNQETMSKYMVLVKSETYVPYDILEQFYCERISLRDIFPKLSYTVVRDVYVDCMDRLYKVYQGYNGEELGDRGTMDYILKSVYGIYVELIDDFMLLVKQLTNIYYQGLSIPHVIGQHLIEELEKNHKIRPYPLHKLIDSPHSFFQFVQSQWDLYVESMKKPISKEGLIIDFESHEIRVYLDNLFQEDYLYPVKVDEDYDVPVWMEAGVLYDTAQGMKNTMQNKLLITESKLQGISSYKDWFVISQLWSDILVLFHNYNYHLEDYFAEELTKLKEKLLLVFKDWMTVHYNKLHSLSYIKAPVVVHKIPWHIESRIKQKGINKVALIVIDGMSLDDWKIMKSTMTNKLKFNEHLAFAWVPTTTSFSRQAIFSGEIPAHFEDTVLSTNHDEKHWKKFWIERGYKDNSIAFIRNIITLNEEGLINLVEDDRVKILGFVINAVDNFLHNAQFSTRETYNSIKFWVQTAGFENMLKKLLDRNFEIYIASDHGNIESTGIGSPREGLAVETAGQRVRVYDSAFNSDKINETHQGFLWNGMGLPKVYHYFLCNKSFSFSKKDESIMSHGGISIEEVIVPFIHIRKED